MEGETRILVPSPRDVPSYDLKPEMSAAEVAERVCDRIGDAYGFAVVNLANPDMVGHTGSIPAVVAAVEATDDALGSPSIGVPRFGRCALPADHGNAEVMLEPDGTVSPHTATPRIRCRSSSRTRESSSRTGASWPTSRPPFWGCSGSRFRVTDR